MVDGGGGVGVLFTFNGNVFLKLQTFPHLGQGDWGP